MYISKYTKYSLITKYSGLTFEYSANKENDFFNTAITNIAVVVVVVVRAKWIWRVEEICIYIYIYRMCMCWFVSTSAFNELFKAPNNVSLSCI